jgi:hypothetical protein
VVGVVGVSGRAAAVVGDWTGGVVAVFYYELFAGGGEETHCCVCWV